MSDFDPYLKWLGIRETARPINCYRLLGLDLFESDPDVISMASDRQMTHVRTYQGGPNGAMSQEILNELARARRCLLVPEKKAQYDAELRVTMSSPNPADAKAAAPQTARFKMADSSDDQVSPPPIQTSVAPMVDGSSIGVKADGEHRAKTKRREIKQLVWSIFGWISGGLAALGVGAWLIGSGLLPNSKPANEDPPVDNKAVASAPKLPSEFARNENPPDRKTDHSVVKPGAVDQAPIKTLPPKDQDQVTTSNQPVTEQPTTGQPSTEQPVTHEIASPFDQPAKSTEVQYDFTNLNSYPKPKADAFRLIREIKREVPEGKTIRFEPSAIQGGSDDYRVVPEDGAILIGLAMTTASDLVVNAIQPIFYDGLRAGAGPAIPSIGPESTCFIAKPGYAVGELEISALQPIKCLRLKFMKISKTGLDPKDYYMSKWQGRKVGPVRTIPNQRGLPIVGVYGRSDKVNGVVTLGLIGMDASAKTTKNPGSFTETSPTTGETPDPNTAEPIIKFPQPSTRERSAARKDLPRSIQELIANAKDVRDVMQVARLLVDDASPEQDPVLRYVVLEEAIRLSESVGDAETAIKAFRELDRTFEIEFWKEAEKSLERAARNPRPLTAKTFKKTMSALIEEAKTKGLFDEASKLVVDAIGFSKRAKDAKSTSFYESQRKEIQGLKRLADGSVKAVAVLALNPDDPAANLVQGDFMFVFKDDLEAATTHWKKSSDEDLVDLSNRDSDLDGSDAAEVVALADKWYEMGESNRTARDRKCLQRANELYILAVKSLRGLAKQGVVYKLAALRKLLKP